MDCPVSGTQFGTEPRCQCETQTEGYNETYDARFCQFCRCWLENRCSNPTCPECANRPPVAPE